MVRRMPVPPSVPSGTWDVQVVYPHRELLTQQLRADRPVKLHVPACSVLVWELGPSTSSDPSRRGVRFLGGGRTCRDQDVVASVAVTPGSIRPPVTQPVSQPTTTASRPAAHPQLQLGFTLPAQPLGRYRLCRSLHPGDVFRQFDVARAGLLRFRQLKRLPDDLGDDVGVNDRVRPFGDRLEQADHVPAVRVALVSRYRSMKRASAPPLTSRICMVRKGSFSWSVRTTVDPEAKDASMRRASACSGSTSPP